MAIQYNVYSKLNARLVDCFITGAGFFLAYQLRFDWQVPGPAAYQMWLLLPAIMVGQLMMNSAFGTYNHIWRYISLTDAILVARAYAAFAIVLLLLRLGLPMRAAILRVPLSVVAMTFLISLLGALGARASRRLLFEKFDAKNRPTSIAKHVLLVGAGRAGVMVSKEIAQRVDLRAVGFLDDDPQKAGAVINGLKVLGPLDSLLSVVRGRSVEKVIICIARVPRATLKKLWALCDAIPVPIEIVPTLEELLDGKVNVANFRAVEMADLLGREAVELDYTQPEFQAAYSGKRILITGAGGTIGSELAMQLRQLNPEMLILLDKDENGLHDACVRLRAEHRRVIDFPAVADLRFPERLGGIFSQFRPEIVFHAAAHKHVDLMEMNPCEAIINNVVGTRNLLAQCRAFGVSRFVLISTDKAVKPSCIMGASKRVCEMAVQKHGKTSDAGTLYACVRFGNVMGSRGSVIPLFREQIARGGPVSITHREVQRFFMTISEAVQLVIQAATLGSSGELFVLDMGDPLPIVNVARDLIELSGLRPDRDIQIEITKLRPGEKLREELYDSSMENIAPTRLEKIWMVQSERSFPADLDAKMAALEAAARGNDSHAVYRVLGEMGFGFVPQSWPAGTLRSDSLERVVFS